MSAGGAPRVVAITPIAVERDSRTFKQAASVARLGYESWVVEGEPSALDRGRLPFRLLTDAPPPVAPAGRGRLPVDLRAVGRTLRSALTRPSRVRALYAAGLYARRWGPVTARALPPADLYVLHSPRQYLGLRLRARGRRPRFVYDAHDFYLPERGREPVDRLLVAYERRCVREAAAVTTAAEGFADLMEREFGRRPEVLLNAHDPRIDEPPPVGLRSRLALGDDAFLLVMPGNAKEGTTAEEAIAAIADLPDRVHLAFVGRGWDRFAEAVAARGVEGRVHLVPALPPTQLVPFIADADAAVVLYRPLTVDYLHMLPNRVFTPIAAGLPVLYPEGLPALRAFAETHGLGLPFDPTEPSALAAAVRRLLEEPGVLARHRAAARAARETVTWEREERKLAAVVDAALGRA